MDYQVTEMGSLFPSGIKRHVKDKRMSKTAKLNVSLASKIKTKIINNSSIFKISLKHNNRALAQALSREKENSRRMATEKMLLQKEVEKLNFENTFLRLKLNNLNKKLIEIEAHLNNSLITAIEMSNFSEFHQSPFLLPASKNKRVSKQCMSMRLPFARVPLTSNDDDDDEDKEKMQHDNNFLSKTSSDVPTLVSTRQSLSPQYNLELCLKENNQNVCLDDSEQISSIIDILPKENYSHYEQSSKSSLMSEMKNSQPISHKQEIPSFNNITKRKKLASFLESNNPCPDNPCMTDLNQEGILSPELNGNNNINDHTNERNIKMQRNIQCLPDSSESASEPAPECMNQVQGNDDFQEQKTVYDTDMDLTASEVVSQIVTVSKGTKNKRNNKPNDCATKTFRKVKDSSSEKKRERSKRQIKNSSEMNVEEKIENEPEKRPVGLNDSGDSEDPNSIFSTEQLTQLNKLKTITLHNDFDQDDRQSTENGKKKKKKKKRIHVTNEQEETYSFSQNSDKFQQESKLDMDMTSLAYDKNKASRQTFVIHKLEKGHLFLNQKDQETISENLEITNEFQTADLATKHNGNLCDYETQNTLDLKKHVTDAQSAQQHESKVIKKLRQKVNRKTEIISEMNQIHGDNDQDVHCPEKSNFSIHTQADKEIISGNLEVSNEFQKTALHTSNNGSLCDCEPQNVLDLQKLVTEAFPVQQNKSKASNLRQRVNRKTVVISEVNHLCKDKNVYCPENGNPFCLTQTNKEIIPENLDDASEFQAPALSTRVDRNLSDCETQNILEVKKHANDTQTSGQKESKIDKLRKKVCRKTEIISENLVHENDDKDTHDPEKGNLFSLTQKDNKIIPENLEDSNDFQIVDPSPRGNRNLCYENGNLYWEKKQATKMLPAKPNGSKINKRLRDKGSRKTEIILEMNQISEFNKGMHDPENGNFFSPTQRDKETISVNPEVTNEFQTAYLSTKDNGNLYDYENLNMLALKRYVTDIQPAQQNVSKINRQKVNRKTEIISEAYQIYRDNDKDVHGQESYTKDLDFKVHESKQRLECQGIISGYCMEINSNEKENCEQISNPYKQKKHGKESSGKTKNILAKNKSIFQLTDSSQTPVSLESDLKQVANEADSDSSNQMGAHKNPKQSTTTFNKKSDIPFAEVMKGECQIKRRSKMTSKSKKRKTLIDPSPYSHEVMHIISDTSQRMPVGSEQADEQNLENEKTKPDFYTKMFNSLSQIYSPNIQDSSHNGVHEGSRALRSSSSKNLMIKKNVALESSPVCAVSDDVQEEMAGMTFQVTQRTQRSGAGGRTLQDLTNTNFVSNNTATSENKSEDLILELPKRRRCTPLNLKEPSLKDKMRR
ncbi:PREDICTED: shugoshin-like 2 isoform X1 [Myotis brandtii]|uniref:shugoshin-like 2 isoform X1 n=3 Tax=Myotis brandtii TaxID=109478 RepID=UPI0007044F61|nr:PREDICTED: shugoshin-like 2 isoform X1 [Myotis brandtii]